MDSWICANPRFYSKCIWCLSHICNFFGQFQNCCQIWWHCVRSHPILLAKNKLVYMHKSLIEICCNVHKPNPKMLYFSNCFLFSDLVRCVKINAKLLFLFTTKIFPLWHFGGANPMSIPIVDVIVSLMCCHHCWLT